jgi:hypothetical protein
LPQFDQITKNFIFIIAATPPIAAATPNALLLPGEAESVIGNKPWLPGG